jgi:flagellar biosynthetic protein FliQ
MEADQALYLLKEMVWGSLIIAGPLLGVTLLVGLAIGVFQVTTQLQEITLSYVPKILAAALVLILLGPWMLARLTLFARSLYQMIAGVG